MHGNPAPEIIRFRGLESAFCYQLYRDGSCIGEYTGAALMDGGILLPVLTENYDSCQYYAVVKE